MPHDNRRILIVDDNREIHGDFRKILVAQTPIGATDLNELEAELFGGTPSVVGAELVYELDSAFQGQDGYERVVAAVAAGRPYALAFVDMRMPPGWDGVETIEHIWQADPDIQVVICSAYSDYAWEDILRRLGSGDRLLILKKPFDSAEVCQLACALTEKWHLARHAHLKLNQLRGMVAERTHELAATNARLEAKVLEHRQTEVALRDSMTQYQASFEMAAVGKAHIDPMTGRFIRVNRKLADLTGYGCDDLLRMTVDDVTHPDDRAADTALRAALIASAAALDGPPAEYFNEKRYVRKDGRTIWVQVSATLVRPAGGSAPHTVAVIQDITDRKMAEAQLRHDAFHDPLTGLANRALLNHHLIQCLARAKRDPTAGFAVLFMDLDRFKMVNDVFGHEVGDHLLLAVAGRLRESIRGIDVLFRPDVASCPLVRLGGDEFVLLLESVGSPSAALAVGERLRAALAEPLTVDGHALRAHASVGIAVYQPGYDRPEEVLRDADTALYRAKVDRGTCAIFDRSMHEAAVNRWRTESDLRGAIGAGQLELHFQPIVDLATGAVVELEALVRWNHPERGLIPPAEFIPMAEEIGMIVPISRWAIRRACELAGTWTRPVGASTQLAAVAVNLSGRDLAQPDLVDVVGAILAETGFDPARLRLELTETSIVENAAGAATLSRLHALGVSIHLDDFGTGYSSLSYLHRMPVDVLKVDRSFISTMRSDPTSRSIVRTIVALAHTLKLKVVAEGVESLDQAVLLRELGCDFAQGYLFARPMPAAELAGYLARTSTSAVDRSSPTMTHAAA